MRIGLLSDTHGYIDDKAVSFFQDCEEIWHAGDIGLNSVLNALSPICPVKAVFGNIDDKLTRLSCPEYLVMEREGLKILMIHIAGPFAKYYGNVRKLILEHKPGMLVCGHSHILKISYDQSFSLLYVNPGAYGIQGFHQVRTALRFEILNCAVKNMEIYEISRSL